jgi:NADPH:quinone reductase-like Zn-dependent oxidoreductase
MSLAAFATAYGGPEVLELRNVEVGPPGDGEVLIEVRAAGVNPIDWKFYSGHIGADPAQLPMPIGLEGAGVVIAVGGGVADVAVGDEVLAYPAPGAAAEQVVVPAGSVVLKPAGLSFETAGGLLLVGGTAWHMLEATRVGEGDVVLLHGAAGGVGIVAAQLAVARGARVIGTASPARHEQLRSLGVEPVAYGEGLQARVRELAPDGVDAALDAVGTQEALDVSVALVGDRSRRVSIANFSPAGNEAFQTIGNGPGADPGTELRAAARPKLAALAATGELQLPTRAVPLTAVADAHRESIAGHALGKVVLVP